MDTESPDTPPPPRKPVGLEGSPARTFDPHVCQNCGDDLEGLYCTTCGQRRITAPITFWGVIKGAWERVAQVDRGFFHTFVGLMVSPGPTIREYLDGKRITHASPFRYYLILGALWMAYPVLIGFDSAAFVRESVDNVFTPELLELLQTSGDHVDFEQMRAAVTVSFEWRRWLSLVNLPMIAVGCWVMYRRLGRSFAEWLAFSLYVNAQNMIVGVLTLTLLAAGHHIASNVASFIFLPYLVWALRGFSGEGWWWTIGKTIVAAFGLWIALSCLVGCGIGIYAVAGKLL